MYNLKTKYPNISKEWDYSKNEKSPEEYLPYSNKRVSWVCQFGHQWDAIISNRTNQNNNCPICFKNESWSENYVYSVISKIFEVSKHANPEIDIYIKELNIGIEYDGYYHKFRYDLDNKKNLWASKNLELLIRIRESYLPELTPYKNVIIIKQRNSGIKACQESILEIADILRIDKNLDFDVRVESKIRNTNLSKDIVDSWSPNNKTDISRALKTHKYLWICDKCNSEYSSEFRYRLSNKGCPFCSSQKVNPTNSLYNSHKNILKYISPNNEVDPKTVTYGTGKKLKFLLNSKEYNTTPRNFNRIITNH